MPSGGIDWDADEFLATIPAVAMLGTKFYAAMKEIVTRYTDRDTYYDTHQNHHIIPHTHKGIIIRERFELLILPNDFKTYFNNLVRIRQNFHVYMNLTLYIDAINYLFGEDVIPNETKTALDN